MPSVPAPLPLRAHVTSLLHAISIRDWRTPAAPWRDFFSRFSLPPRRNFLSTSLTRLSLNSHIYQANYIALLLLALLLLMLRAPRAALAVAPSAALWVRATSPRPLVIRGRRVTRRQRFGGAAVISVVLALVVGMFGEFVTVGAVALGVCLLHACLRHSHVRHGSQMGMFGEEKEMGVW